MTEIFFELLNQYGYFAVFLFAMLDHTGTPGAVMVAAGLAAAGVMNLWAVLIVSILGGLAGDLLLYSIGRWAGEPVMNAFVKRNPKFQEAKSKVSGWIDTYGGTVVIWARFVALIGRYASAVYGMFRYSFSKFVVYSLIGGGIMVVAFGLPTYFIGNQLNELVDNPLFTLYLTGIVIVLQLVISVGLYMRKKKKVASCHSEPREESQ